MMPAVPARVDLATPAAPDQGSSGTARARRRAAALGVIAALLVPLPAAAAPAPCEQALRYAAQSGAELMRIGDLDLGPAGRDDQPIRDVGVGDAKSALVAQSAINSAALGRMLDGGPAGNDGQADRGGAADHGGAAGRKALTEVFQQTAPPTHQEPNRREHEAAEVGPFRLGAGRLTVHARWEPGMACGNAEGEATRAQTELRQAGVLDDGDNALVRVPGKISGRSTTAMHRRGPAARAVAAAALAGGTIELLGGAVRVEIVQPPSLLAAMSGTDGGEVRYRPAELKVSGEGLKTARLDTAGDNVEFRLNDAPGPDRTAAEEDTEDQDAENGPFAGLPEAGTLAPGAPLPLPSLPAVPPLGAKPGTEGAPAAGPGTTVRVSLGDVRQAVSGHAIAAKATAINIAITQGSNRRGYGHSAPNRSGVILDFDLGLLEVAAVAPEPEGGASSTVGDNGEVAGGGLPITGPRLDALALAGVALLIAGAAALIFGLRGRSRP